MATSRATVSGSTLDGSQIQAFRNSIQGSVILPGDPGYEEACAIWNAMISRRPAIVSRCATTGDVVATVNFARQHNLLVAVRGGGHNVAGNAVCDDGIVIDLSDMREIEIDAENRTARVQGGAKWQDLDRATGIHGLATTGGQISTTGVGGLTLGGGVGWLIRKYGLACDNLIGAEVVTASGGVVRASESENADLLWGLRGGGGNFGVVTSFEFRLHPVSSVLGGMLIYPYEQAREVMRFYRDFTRTAPDELMTICVLMTSPEGEKIVAIVISYCGLIEEGEDVLRALREFGPPLADMIQPMPYTQMQQILDEGFPPGMHNYWRSDFLNALSDDAIDTTIEHFDNVASPLTAILIEQFGGAVNRVPVDATAFPHRTAAFNLTILARWADPAEADLHITWTRDLHQELRQSTIGVYVNYLGQEGSDRVKAAYGEKTYARLAALKRTYDPDNLFRLNQNIEPAEAPA